MKKIFIASTDTTTEDLMTDGMTAICDMISTECLIAGLTADMIEEWMTDIINILTATDMEDARIQSGGCSGHFSSSNL